MGCIPWMWRLVLRVGQLFLSQFWLLSSITLKQLSSCLSISIFSSFPLFPFIPPLSLSTINSFPSIYNFHLQLNFEISILLITNIPCLPKSVFTISFATYPVLSWLECSSFEWNDLFYISLYIYATSLNHRLLEGVFRSL